jgi:hypothetical protein
MCTAATVTTIGTTQCSEFVPSEMLTSSTTMATATKNSDLVYEIAFFQNCTVTTSGKYTLYLAKRIRRERD